MNPASTTRRRAGFGALLAVGMASSTFVFTAFGVLARFLIDDFGLSRGRVGLLTSVAAATGALASPPAGRVADVVGGRRTLLFTYAFGAASILAVAAAPGYGLVAAGAFVAGVAQAAANPGTNKLIAAHIAPARRGLITGVKQSGVTMGTMVGGLLLPPLALATDWRVALGAFALVPAAAFVAAAAVIPADGPSAGERRRQKTTAAVRWLALYGLLMGLGGGAVFGFVPLYAQEGLGLSVTAGGLAISLVGLVGIGARIGWGRMAERLPHPVVPLAWLSLLAVGSVALLALAEPLWAGLLWPAAVLVGLSVSSWNSVAMLAVMHESGYAGAGSASGVVQFGFLAGLAAGPPLFGMSVDVLDTYQWGWAVVMAVFALALVPAQLSLARSGADQAH